MLPNRTKQPTSLRLSPEARKLLALLATRMGLSMTGVLEMTIREKARAEGVAE